MLYKNLVRYKCAMVVLEEGWIKSVKLDFHMVHFLYLSVDELYKQNKKITTIHVCGTQMLSYDNRVVGYSPNSRRLAINLASFCRWSWSGWFLLRSCPNWRRNSGTKLFSSLLDLWLKYELRRCWHISSGIQISGPPKMICECKGGQIRTT